MKYILGLASLIAWESLGAAKELPLWKIGCVLAGDCDLWQVARQSAQLMESHRELTGVLLLDGPPGSNTARLSVVSQAQLRARRISGVNTGTPEIARLVATELEKLPGRFSALVLFGHGEPIGRRPIASVSSWSAGLLADWSAGGDALSPAELALALSGRRWDVVLLAACSSAVMEFLWSLRGHARYAVAVAGEMQLNAADLVEAIRAVATAPPDAKTAALRAARALQRGGRPGAAEERCAVVTVDVTGLESAAGTVRTMIETALRQPEQWRYAWEACRPGVVAWHDGLVLDAASICSALARALPDGCGAREAAQAAAALRAAVLDTGWVNGRVEGAVGLGVCKPPDGEKTQLERDVPLWELWQWIDAWRLIFGPRAPLGNGTSTWAGPVCALTGGGSRPWALIGVDSQS
ncbi:MAG: hypothetical protein H5T86_10195 [Armatimonadetes bacterium]|nr:hypothetical protein [Armatimonadota bacterium]